MLRPRPLFTALCFSGSRKQLGLDPNLYGTHLGRRGGATGAAATDVPDRLFKQHGHWRSERAKDLYVVDRLSARLSITRTLGLQPSLAQSKLEAFEREACFFNSSVCALYFPHFFYLLCFLFSLSYPLSLLSLPLSFCTCLHEPLCIEFWSFAFHIQCVVMSADLRSENCEFSTFAVSREPRFFDPG
jgi:hypothetical protein